MNEFNNQCLDINECEIGQHNCNNDQMVCYNTYGSFYCDCQQQNSCKDNYGINLNCQIKNGVEVCSCDIGFQFKNDSNYQLCEGMFI
jgi:hypothetical protein